MPDDNVELVKQGFAALRDGGVDALMPFIHPEFEATTPAELASEPDTYRGHEGIRRYFESFYEAMENVYFEGHEFTPLGDKVVVDMALHATGRTTGIETTQEGYMVWTIKDGKAIKLEVFPERDQAMAAARA